MAKPLTPEQIEAITQATKNIDRLTRLQVYTLATTGMLTVEEGAFKLTGKALRAQARAERKAKLKQNIPLVREAALKILTNDEARCNHRAIWNELGRDNFERDEILEALRALRDEGIVQTDNASSSNNFQIFWKRGPGAPVVAVEEVEVAVVEEVVAE